VAPKKVTPKKVALKKMALKKVVPKKTKRRQKKNAGNEYFWVNDNVGRFKMTQSQFLRERKVNNTLKNGRFKTLTCLIICPTNCSILLSF
jgi:hypothetical protein